MERPTDNPTTQVAIDSSRATEPSVMVHSVSNSQSSSDTSSKEISVNNPNQKKKKNFSEETVISRARRMFRSEMKKVSQALGMENYDKEAFDKKLQEIIDAKKSGETGDHKSEQKTKELEGKVAELTQKLGLSQSKVLKLEKEVATKSGELEKTKTEFEIKEIASTTGLRDLDYGLHLLRSHIRTLPKDQAIDPEGVKSYFEGLKKSKAHLFGEEKVPAGPRPLADQSRLTDSVPPAPPPPPPPGDAKGASNEVNASKMDKREFSKHAQENYGYRPGMA